MGVDSISQLYDVVNKLNETIKQSDTLQLVQEKVYTVDEAAKFLRLSKTTVYQYCSDRLIPHSKVGGKTLFLQSELIQWLQDKKCITAAEIAQRVNQTSNV